MSHGGTFSAARRTIGATKPGSVLSSSASSTARTRPSGIACPRARSRSSPASARTRSKASSLAARARAPRARRRARSDAVDTGERDPLERLGKAVGVRPFARLTRVGDRRRLEATRRRARGTGPRRPRRARARRGAARLASCDPPPHERHGNERAQGQRRCEQERAREGARHRPIELLLEPVDERAPLVVVGPFLERPLDVGQLADVVRAVDLGEDVLRDAELVERRISLSRTTAAPARIASSRFSSSALVRTGASRTSPTTTPACRAAIVHPPWTTWSGRLAQRVLGEAADGEPEARADEDLRRDRPGPTGARHERERGEPPREEDHAARNALNRPKARRAQTSDGDGDERDNRDDHTCSRRTHPPPVDEE